MGVKVSSLHVTRRLEIESFEMQLRRNSGKTAAAAAAALVREYVFIITSFYLQNFDAMLGEILDVLPDANEQDVRKKLLATGSVEETLDWMLEHQSNNDHTV